MLIVIPYTGIVYYERKKDNAYVVGFVAATERNFKSLVDVRKIHSIITVLFDNNAVY